MGGGGEARRRERSHRKESREAPILSFLIRSFPFLLAKYGAVCAFAFSLFFSALLWPDFLSFLFIFSSLTYSLNLFKEERGTVTALVTPPVLPAAAHFLIEVTQPADEHVAPAVAAPVAVAEAVPDDEAVLSVVAAFLVVVSAFAAPVCTAPVVVCSSATSSMTSSPAGLEG